MKNVILVLFISFYILGCSKQKIEIFHSADKKYCVSKFEYIDDYGKHYTIFCYGKAQNTELPKSYIRVRDTWRDGWESLLIWQKQQAVLYVSGDQGFETFNLEISNLRLQNANSSQEFYQYFFNKIPNNFIKIQNKQ